MCDSMTCQLEDVSQFYPGFSISLPDNSEMEVSRQELKNSTIMKSGLGSICSWLLVQLDMPCSIQFVFVSYYFDHLKHTLVSSISVVTGLHY